MTGRRTEFHTGANRNGCLERSPRWGVEKPVPRRSGREAREGSRTRSAVVGSEHAPTLRHRDVAERRVLAARGFPRRGRLQRVLSDMRLTSGVLWPMPITLDVTEKFAEKLKQGDTHRAARWRRRPDRRRWRSRASIARTSTSRRRRCSARTTSSIPAVSYSEDAQQPRLCRRQAPRSRGACPLRFQALARHS